MHVNRALLPLLGLLAVGVVALPAPGSTLGSGYAGSLLRSTPPDEPSRAGGCRSSDTSPAQEEQRRGTDGWRPTYQQAPVTGWLDRTVARCGEQVGVHLSGPGPAVLTLYRSGWYAGHGARLVWQSGRIATRPRRPIRVEARHRMGEATWPVTTRLRVQESWTPGLYLLVVRPAGTPAAPGAGAVMPLVVPEQRTASPLLAVASTLTWAAYNNAGGWSTYYGPKGSRGVATAASLDRPLMGGGLKHLLTYDLPLARFAGRTRLPMAWTTDDEIDRHPASLAGRGALVFPGHSEYWTARMYDGVEAARNQGVNIAFLGADPVYWQTRLVASPTGERRRMLIYRAVDRDPAADDAPALVTVRWRDAPLKRDESELVGTTFAEGGVHAGMRVEDAPSWLLSGTRLTTGSYLVAAAANEVDRLTSSASARPPNLQVVLRGAFATPSGAVHDFAATYYTAPSGAAVFAAGTTAWPCDLDATCPFGPVPAATSAALRTITGNLLRALSVPRFGLTHPSVPSHVVPVAALWQQLPETIRGTGGRHLAGGIDED